MANKTALKKDTISKPSKNSSTKNKKENAMLDKGTNKIKKPLKASSVAQIDATERSAVDAVKPSASKTVRGSNGLANTGTIISYD